MNWMHPTRFEVRRAEKACGTGVILGAFKEVETTRELNNEETEGHGVFNTSNTSFNSSCTTLPTPLSIAASAFAPAFEINASWLPDMDLNHDKQIQSLLCYRYTIGQCGVQLKTRNQTP